MKTPSFYVETLGCPKNAVDSDKVVATLLADGLVATHDVADADLVVVNTCAFIEAARRESIETILALDATRKPGAQIFRDSNGPRCWHQDAAKAAGSDQSQPSAARLVLIQELTNAHGLGTPNAGSIIGLVGCHTTAGIVGWGLWSRK